MNYKKHYDKLILRARERVLDEGYYEKHHVIPKCLKENNNTDIVKLFPEEHFIAHLLLAKIYSNNYGLILAIRRMSECKNGQAYNNKSYSWVRKLEAKANSKRLKGIPLSEEHKLKLRHPKSESHRKAIRDAKRGEKNPNCTLTIEKVKAIKRDLFHFGLFRVKDLVEKYKVPRYIINGIKFGDTWSWVEI